MYKELLVYRDIPHTYHGIESGLAYESVSKLFEVAKPYQDWDSILRGTAKKYGMTQKALRAIWDEKKNKGTQAGTILHLEEEQKDFNEFLVEFNGELFIPVQYEQDLEQDIKYQIQDLKAGYLYPELIVSYSDDIVRVGGTSDRVLIDSNNYVHIQDYKTDKAMVFEGYKGQTLAGALSHRQDCNFDAYSIKCSCYMYFILKSHPHLKPGSIQLIHKEIERDTSDSLYKDTAIIEDGKVNVINTTVYDVDYSKNEKDVEVLIEMYREKLLFEKNIDKNLQF